jgi:uncharacterized protein
MTRTEIPLPSGIVDLRAWSQTNVAFEVDEIDLARRQGWSVTVNGFGREITGALDRDSERLLRMPVHPWAPGQRDRWFKITPNEITGRRFRSTASASAT